MKRLLRFVHRDRNTVVAQAEVRSRDIGVLGLDSRVRGQIEFQGALTVDGTVSGDVRSPEGSGAMLIVGQSATIQGDIVSDSVLISGRVSGNVKARQRVEIFGTGILHGDIETGDIMIQGGAEFQGRCQMLKQAPVVRAGIGGMAPAGPREAGAESVRRGRKGRGSRADRPESGSSGENSALEHAEDGLAVRQDSRAERGGTTEGPSA
ncbi:MAG: polymer-forming cytoskeletal protein [SAR324 cluster bacterium]